MTLAEEFRSRNFSELVLFTLLVSVRCANRDDLRHIWTMVSFDSSALLGVLLRSLSSASAPACLTRLQSMERVHGAA